MRRAFGLLLFFLLSVSAVFAQNTPPDYAIRNIRSRVLEPTQQGQIQFEVWNIGGASTVTSTATLTVIASGQEIATDVVPPLKAQEIVTISLTFPLSLFPPNSVQSLRAAVGVGEVEAPGSANVQSNFAQITVTTPETQSAPAETAEAPGVASTSTGKKDILAEFLDSLNIRLNLNDRTQVAVLIGIAGAVLLLLLIIIVILRLLFQRPVDFGSWQPPYAYMPYVDPNSLAGRRQQWQAHAQSTSLPAGCVPGSLHARKLTTGVDGQVFSGWRVTAVRLSQYDTYGRVTRSQVIAPKRLVGRLNSIARRRSKLKPDKLSKQLRSVAAAMLSPFKKKLNDRTVMLPVALDVRLQGKHGEIRIIFELYQCQAGRWNRIDQWEPEMVVTGKTIPESYTYTLFGMQPGETPKTFRRRLVNDLTQTLVEMIAPPSAEVEQDSKPTNPHLQSV